VGAMVADIRRKRKARWQQTLNARLQRAVNQDVE
jgi:hypothetical protein